MGLEENTVVHDGTNDGFHVVRLIRAVGDDGIQCRIHPAGIIARRNDRRVFHVVGRQV